MKYSVVVIGAGPGGYVAAIRAAQLGMKVAIVEKYPDLGGTCLNVGCIPSKALLDSSEHYHNAAKRFEDHGIVVDKMSLNFPRMRSRKDRVVHSVCQGLKFLMQKNKITIHQGVASFEDPHTVRVQNTHDTGAASTVIEAEHIVIATGSKPALLPAIQIDKHRIITSTEALSLPEVPKRLVVIGGGAIGLELGSVYARLGTEVDVVEYAHSIIPTMDESMGKLLQRALNDLPMRFHLQQKVVGVDATENTAVVHSKDANDKEASFEADHVLISVGRRPYTDGLNLERIGITPNEKGQIPVNEHLQTTHAHIYAIGDVIQGPMLAHKAEEEGVFVAERMAGQQPHINYLLIPNVVYTWPEVAAVGHTTAQVKQNQTPYKIGRFPFKALGRAKASGDEQGEVKVLAHAHTDELLGVHIIGPRAADMIAAAVTAMEFSASAEDIARTSHAHPTYMEALKEACLDATGSRALHA